MTAAQKQNQKRFKAAQLEAKKLRLKNPKLSHRDALKQAFAIEYKTIGAAKKPKIKKAIVKKTVKKTVAKKTVKKIKKPHTHWGTIHAHKRRVNGIKRPGEKSVLKSIEHAAKVQKKHMGIKVGMLPTYKDQEAAREIQLYADNDSTLYYQKRLPILKNLSKKYIKGTYDINKAAKLWRYYIDAAMQKYNKEFGSRGNKWHELLSVSDRNILAHHYAIETKDEFDLGNLY